MLSFGNSPAVRVSRPLFYGPLRSFLQKTQIPCSSREAVTAAGTEGPELSPPDKRSGRAAETVPGCAPRTALLGRSPRKWEGTAGEINIVEK